MTRPNFQEKHRTLKVPKKNTAIAIDFHIFYLCFFGFGYVELIIKTQNRPHKKEN
jgi:hypothetical protein